MEGAKEGIPAVAGRPSSELLESSNGNGHTSRLKRRAVVAGSIHQALIDHYASCWQQAYPSIKFKFDGAKEGEQIRAIRETIGDDLVIAKAMIDAYFADKSEWLVKNRHPLTTLRSQVHKYVPVRPRQEPVGPVTGWEE